VFLTFDGMREAVGQAREISSRRSHAGVLLLNIATRRSPLMLLVSWLTSRHSSISRKSG
jgi:hypothetical protein